MMQCPLKFEKRFGRGKRLRRNHVSSAGVGEQQVLVDEFNADHRSPTRAGVAVECENVEAARIEEQLLRVEQARCTVRSVNARKPPAYLFARPTQWAREDN